MNSFVNSVYSVIGPFLYELKYFLQNIDRFCDKENIFNTGEKISISHVKLDIFSCRVNK